MGTGQGMQKDQWEQKMFKFFVTRIIPASPFGNRFQNAGLIIRYIQDEVKTAEWETVALHQTFDFDEKKFHEDSTPPDNPLERRAWDADRRKKRSEAEQRIRSKTGKKCPVCGGWDTERVAPQDQSRNIILPLAAKDDYLACHTCKATVMWNSEELEQGHDTEIIVKGDILSRPFQYEGKMLCFRHAAIDIWKVNGTHESWRDDEVRKMIYTMWTEVTVDVWAHEAQVAFVDKMVELLRS